MSASTLICLSITTDSIPEHGLTLLVYFPTVPLELLKVMARTNFDGTPEYDGLRLRPRRETGRHLAEGERNPRSRKHPFGKLSYRTAIWCSLLTC